MDHKIEYLSINGLFPAAACSCGKFCHTFTRTSDDTNQTVKARLDEAHREHVEEATNTTVLTE